MFSFVHSDWFEFTKDFVPFLTAALALLIYFEAKYLRKIDSFSKSVSTWQDFNKLMLNKELSERWEQIYTGKVPWASITQQDKAIIYSYLNILSYEYLCSRAGTLDRLYADKSVGDNILYFRYIWDGLHQHLKDDGWPRGFITRANELIKKRQNIDRTQARH
ncbi:MAG TPA: hypothetical protein VGH23_16615 [Rhizomicrobium sp.]|jgi:hypothetical protein